MFAKYAKAKLSGGCASPASGSFCRTRSFLGRTRNRSFPGAHNTPPSCWFDCGAFDLQQGSRLVEQLSQISVLALHATEVNREQQDCTFAAPNSVDHHFTPRGLRSDILGGDSVDPSLTPPFQIATEVTTELQHKNLEGGAACCVVSSGDDLRVWFSAAELPGQHWDESQAKHALAKPAAAAPAVARVR